MDGRDCKTSRPGITIRNVGGALMVALLLLLGFSVSMALANDPYPITMRDQTPTEPLAAPDPSSFQPRYISGFGSGEAFTVFFEDRDNGSAISYAATTSGPAGLSSPPTATNIADTHFVVKDWPINVGETDYAYRAWASVGNNADHRFYVSNDLVNWTTVSTFTITNAATFTGAKGSVYYGFHDVIELNGTYYAFAESNQSQTMLVRSDNGDDVWEAFDSVGGTSGDGPLELPLGVTSGWTPSGSFFELKDDAGYGKIHVDPRDSAFYLAINTAAKPSLSPADLETAFIDPDNWSWHDGTTGPAASPILAETAEHDLREAWLVPDASSPLTLIYDADFGSGDGGKALGYAIVGGIPDVVYVDDDWTDQTDVDAYDSSLTWEYDAFQVVQDGLDGVATGGTVHVLAGTYNENILIKRRVAIRGAGSDPNGAVITQTQAGAGDSKVGVVQIAASGLSDAEPLLLQNLRIETDHLAGISVGRFVEVTGEDIAYVKLNNVKVIGTNTNPNSEQERGLYVDTTSSLRHLVVEDSAFNNLTYGWYLQKEVSTDVSTVRYVTVTNTTFSHNNLKGLYAEKLSDASFTNCTVDGNGFSSDGVPSYFLPWMAGIDINLKAGIYENLIFTNCAVTNNALGGAANGVGLTVKARDDGGSYGPYPATLDGVTINGGTYSGNKAGIRLGEPGKANAGPTGAQVRDATLADNLDYGFSSQTQAAVTVVGNTFENHTKVFSQATGSLMAYANNVMTFTTGIISNTGATVNAMHNWWGAIDPTGVGDTDAYDFRLGAPVASYTDGTGSVTLADTTAGGDASLSGAGTLVIVNHGNGLTNVPFAKGIDPDANNSCADFHDFFAIDGSGTYTVSIPISITCQSNTDITTNNPRIYQFLLDAAGAPDPGCTPDTARWKAITATYNSGALTANVDVSELLGTPFAAPSNNNTDPTALILSTLSIRAALLLPAIGLLIVTVTLIIAIAPVRSSDLGLCRWFQ